MKKIYTLLLLLFISIQVFGQRNEKIKTPIKAHKIAFITEQLDLTTEEAEKFWPIYNAHEKEMEMLRFNKRENHDNLSIDSITEEEAKKALLEMLAFEEEEHRLKVDLINNLSKVIPAKKVILLRKVEWQFKKTMLEEMRRRIDKYRKNRP